MSLPNFRYRRLRWNPTLELVGELEPNEPIAHDEEYLIALGDPDAELSQAFAGPPSPTLGFRFRGMRVEFNGNRAAVAAPLSQWENAIAAIADMATNEQELSEIETQLGQSQSVFDVDSAGSFAMSSYGKRQYYADCAAQYTAGLMMLIRSKPRWLAARSTLSPVARGLYRTWLQRANVELRVAAIEEELEARWEIYEAAADRSTDYWGWVHGHRLEIAIIILLFVEVVLLVLDMYIR